MPKKRLLSYDLADVAAAWPAGADSRWGSDDLGGALNALGVSSSAVRAALFASFADGDGDGSVSSTEVGCAMAVMAPDASVAEKARSCFKLMAGSSGGSVRRAELEPFFGQFVAIAVDLVQDCVRCIDRMFDPVRESDVALNSAVVGEARRKMQDLRDGMRDRCFAAADADQSGTVDQAEFLCWVEGDPQTSRWLQSAGSVWLSQISSSGGKKARERAAAARKTLEASFANMRLDDLTAVFPVDAKDMKQEEVAEKLQELGISDESLADQLFKAFDPVGKGRVKVLEFVCGVSLLCCKDPDEHLRFAFQVLDNDGNGQVTKEEMQRFVKTFQQPIFAVVGRRLDAFGKAGQVLDSTISKMIVKLAKSSIKKMSKEIVSKLWKQADSDGDGGIDFVEFSGFVDGSSEDGMDIVGWIGAVGAEFIHLLVEDNVAAATAPPPSTKSSTKCDKAASAQPAAADARAKANETLGDVDLDELMLQFSRLDAGTRFNLPEFRSCLATIKFSYPSLADRLFQSFDDAGTGSVDRKEIMCGVALMSGTDSKARLRLLFIMMSAGAADRVKKREVESLFKCFFSLKADIIKTVTMSTESLLGGKGAEAMRRVSVRCRDLMQSSHQQLVQRAFKRADSDGSGSLDFAELSSWLDSEPQLLNWVRHLGAYWVKVSAAAAKNSELAFFGDDDAEARCSELVEFLQSRLGGLDFRTLASVLVSHGASLSESECAQCLQQIGVSNKKMARAVFSVVCQKGKMQVSTAEYVCALAMLCSPSKKGKNKLKFTFHAFDTDHSGSLSKKELTGFFSAFKQPVHAAVDSGLRGFYETCGYASEFRSVVSQLTEDALRQHIEHTVNGAMDFSAEPEMKGATFIEWAGANPAVGTWIDQLSQWVFVGVSKQVSVKDFREQDFIVVVPDLPLHEPKSSLGRSERKADRKPSGPKSPRGKGGRKDSRRDTGPRVYKPGRSVSLAAAQAPLVSQRGAAESQVWGWAQRGQLGVGWSADEAPQNQDAPVPLSFFSGVLVRQLACGNSHSLACTSDGRLFAWGSGEDGRLGLGDTRDRQRPEQVTSIREEYQADVAFVAAGEEHSGAISTQGHLFTWGGGANFKLGVGDQDDALEPTQVAYLGSQKCAQFACDAEHSVALTATGEVFTWGTAGGGRLGHPVKRPHVTKPQKVEGLPPAVMVAAGESFSAFLCSDGNVYGTGAVGLEGKPALSEVVLPHAISGLASHGEELLGIAAGGSLLVAFSKARLSISGWGTDDERRVLSAPSKASFQTVAAGRASVLALFDDGTVYSIGDNYYGQLGRTEVIPGGNGSDWGRWGVVRCRGDVETIGAGDFHCAALISDS